MRNVLLTALGLTLVCPLAFSQLASEELTVETMPERGSNWYVAKSGRAARVFDAESGDMLGMLSISDWTPAVTMWNAREEFYAPETYFARGTHGERTDVVTIYDYENLVHVGEVIIPNHMARLGVRGHLAILNNGRHLAVHNMNPGHSVSIVDVQDRVFVYEVSTPGCAINMAVGDADFLQICGDGTLQLIQLDLSGFEQNRERSDVFFDVQADAVFDRVARTSDGWLLITHAGVLFEVSTDDDEINISAGWTIPEAAEGGWRPGGRGEFLSVHHETGLLYVAMHQGGVDTHHDRGTEVWVIDLGSQRLIHRLEQESEVATLLVTQETNAKLLVSTEAGNTLVHDAFTFELEREIDSYAEMLEDY